VLFPTFRRLSTGSFSIALLSFALSAFGQTASTVSLTAPSTPSSFGSTLTLTAQVTPSSATGHVTFYSDGTVLGIVSLTSGSASLAARALPTGAHRLSAHYEGDGSNLASTSATLTRSVVTVGATVFSGGVGIATGSLPVAVMAADLNGDGKPDIASVNESSNSITVALGNGDGTFGAPATSTVGNQPDGITAGDFNRDGILDLAVANYADSSVSILLGVGDGSFQSAHSYTVGSSALAVAVADWNGDGIPDLAVATFSDVKILLGNGDGTFHAPVSYIAGSNPFALAVGDFNADGKADLAVANDSSGSISIFLGRGDGTFLPAATYNVGASPRSIATGDWNEDGKTDLAVANFGSNDISILMGNSDGTFQPAVSYSNPPGASPTGVMASDVNGDGHADLLIAYYGNGWRFNVSLGSGAGTFSSADWESAGAGAYGLAVADFNGDGSVDLAIAGGGTNSVLVFAGHAATLSLSGDGQSTIAGTQFASRLRATVVDAGLKAIPGVFVGMTAPASGAGATLSPVNGSITDASGVAAQDATANRNLGAYTISVNAGLLHTSFHETNILGPAAVLTPANATQRTRVGTAFPKPLQVTVTDIAGNLLSGVTVTFTAPASSASATLSSTTAATNASGVASVTATANAAAGPYTVTAAVGAVTTSFSLTNQGAALLSLSASTSSTTLSSPVTLTAAVTPAAATGTVSFYDGVSFLGTRTLSGGAATLTTSTLATGVRKLRATYSGDSVYSGTASNSATVTVTVLASNYLVPKPSVPLGGAPTAVLAGDFNGDGNLDLAAVTTAAKIQVLLGNSDGTFQSPVSYNTGVVQQAVAVGDFNGDGKPDLITSSAAFFTLFIGNGDGTFQTGVPITVPALASFLLVADFNGDGLADLLASSTTEVRVYLGNGDGTFQTGSQLATSLGIATVAVDDFNGDGKPDLAYVVGGSIVVRIGIGDGTFQNPLLYPSTSSFVNAIAAGDVNGDGYPDLIANGYYAHLILLGNANGTFQSPVSTALPYYSETQVRVTDFNGDGKPDLVTVGGFYGIGVQLGNGTGTFQAAVTYPGVYGPLQLLSGDVNHDSRMDFFSVSGSLASVFQGAFLTMTAPLGTSQTTVAGTPFSSPLQLKVTDSSGNPVSGLPVTFSYPSTGASASLSSTSATTDASGIASITATANSVLGTYTVTATLGPLSATFSLTNALGAAAALTLSGTPQSTRAGTVFQQPLQAIVKDAGGSALSGVTVTFSAPASGASATLSALSAVTDSSGIAKVTATANSTVGSYVVTATAGAASGSFSLNNQGPSTATLTVSPTPASLYGSPVTLTATVTPSSATGSVIFYEGVKPIGGGILSSGSASLTTVNLAAGVRKLKAVYVGDPANASAASNVVTQTVTASAGNIFSTQTLTSTNTTNRVVIADFDGNGKLDIASLSGNGISVLRQLNDGSWQMSNTTVANVSKMIAADFNGDGKMDLAVSVSYGFTILLGNGDGTFSAGPTYATTNYVGNLIAVDLNQDGKPDLVLTVYSTIVVYLGVGDGAFRLAGTVAAGNSIYSIAAGDFNLDGKSDIALGVDFTTLLILLGNGDGTFQTALSSTVGYEPYGIAVDDFNGDGKPDIATANNISTGISVVLGNGDGTFQAAVSYSSGPNYASGLDVVSGDFNGDGKLDLATMTSSGVSVLYGNGGGTFQSAIQYPIPGYGFAIGDLNGDHKADLVIAAYSGVTLFSAATAAITTSGTPQSAVAGTAFTAPLQVTLKDGTTPIVGAVVTYSLPASGASATLSSQTAVTNSSGVASVTATANNLTGNYAVTATTGGLGASFILTNTLGSAASLASANTPQSTAIATTFRKPLRVTVRDAGGNLLSGVVVSFTAPATGASATLSSTTATTDGSGVAGVTATANAVTGSYSVTAAVGAVSATFQLTNQRTSAVSITVPPTVRFGARLNLSATVTPVDATGSVGFYDNGAYLASATVASGSAAVSTILPSGSHSIRAVFSGDSSTAPSSSNSATVAVTETSANLLRSVASPILPSAPYFFAVVDLNGDGFPDLVTTAYPGIYVLLANGDGTFRSPVSYAASTYSSQFVIADCNGDGKPDVIVPAGSNILVLLGKGDGTLQNPISSASSQSGIVAAGDFNGDGRVDLLTATYSNLQVSLGNGDGTFQTPLNSVLPYGGVYGIALGDFNSDGRTDVAVASDGGSWVSAGVGDGTFQTATVVSSTQSRGVVAADLNGDGKLDLIFSYYYANALGVLLGSGSGTFATSLAAVTGPAGLTVLDFDGDGKLDVMVASGNGTALLRGTGTGAFQAPIAFLTPRTAPSTLVAADLNGDGRADLVLGYNNYSDLSVQLGFSGSLTTNGGSGQTALTGTAFSLPLVVSAKDNLGAAVSGVYVTFSAPVSGATASLALTGGTSLTDATGTAGATATANNVAGAYTISASSGLITAAFGLTNTDQASVPAAAVSVTPSSGGGATQAFTAAFNAAKGFRDLQWVELLVAAAPDGAGQSYCFVHYDVQGNGLWLYGDGGFFVGPVAPGSLSNRLQNSLCAVNTSGSSVVGSGTTLTLNASIVFKQSVNRLVYMRAMSTSNFDTGWVQRGSWNPIAAGVGISSSNPATGAGSTQTFTLTYPDPPGFAGAAFGWVQFLVAAAADGGGQPFCFVHYDRGGNGLWMYSSDQGYFVGPVAPGTASNLLSSSACSVNTASATVVNSGGNLVVTVPVTMKAPMAGAKKLFQRTLDTLNRDTGWQQTGTWTVQ